MLPCDRYRVLSCISSTINRVILLVIKTTGVAPHNFHCLQVTCVLERSTSLKSQFLNALPPRLVSDGGNVTEVRDEQPLKQTVPNCLILELGVQTTVLRLFDS